MGTRSSTGFIANGEYKSQYNQFDGYPSGVGSDMVEFIRSVDDWDMFKKHASKVRLVSGDEKPSEDIQKEYIDSGFSNLQVSEQSADDWYCLLRNLQGADMFKAIYEGRVHHMLGANGFILDSLFCEYAYIINLDTMEFEVYEGYQKSPHDTNRFGSDANEDGYYPCKLIHTFKLDDIPENWLEIVEPQEVE